jgi:glycosyltransferase involved in cell wall biosynthesis
MKKKVTILTRAWFPNHQILFEKIYDILIKYNIELSYVILHPLENNRPWSLEFKIPNPIILNGKHISIFGKEIMIGQDVNGMLNYINPDLLIISSWSEFPLYKAKKWAITNGKLCILWLMGPRVFSWSLTLYIRAFISKRILIMFTKGIDEIFSYGNGVTNALVEITGFDTKKIVNVRHSVDKNLYSFNSLSEKIFSRKATRDFYKYNNNEIVFGFIGQLIPRKGLIELLSVCKKLWTKGLNFQLFILGNGPQLDEVLSFKSKWSNFITIETKVDASQLKNIYSIFDCVITPSRFDDWCTVINESFHMGVPVVSTHEAYASRDLIDNGVNGFVYRSGNTFELESIILKILKNPSILPLMGNRAYEFINNCWTIDHSAKIWSERIINKLAASD